MRGKSPRLLRRGLIEARIQSRRRMLPDASPRLLRRGLIEAQRASGGSAARGRSPRLLRRGLIEARHMAASAGCSIRIFRGYYAAASLKLPIPDRIVLMLHHLPRLLRRRLIEAPAITPRGSKTELGQGDRTSGVVVPLTRR